MSEPLYRLTVSEASELLANREITSVELTRAVLDRISAVEEDVKAYLLVAPEEALNQARAADERLERAGKRGDPIPPLLGIPGAIKDAICTKGMETTCGSRILEGYVPPYDATAVARLREAGAVVLGKANTDEFAMGSSTGTLGFLPDAESVGPLSRSGRIERGAGGRRGRRRSPVRAGN